MKLIVELVDWVNHFMMVGYSWRYFSSINQFNFIKKKWKEEKQVIQPFILEVECNETEREE